MNVEPVYCDQVGIVTQGDIYSLSMAGCIPKELTFHHKVMHQDDGLNNTLHSLY